MELIGHNETRRLFLDAWENRDNHSVFPVWLLVGPKGIGKATLAYNLACKVFSDLAGCDVHDQMSVGGLGDLFIVDMEHNLTPKTSISIETIRSVTQKMQMFSMGESWRVVIIDSIDELSRGTDNTLLKTLEEPPEKTIFFLIAHSLEKVLPTIRSRSRVEKLHPLTSMELREIGGKLLPDKEISNDMIKIGGGSFRRIAKMISTGADTLFDDAKRILSDKTANSADRLALAKRIAANPENMSIMLDVISYFGLAELYPIAASEIERTHNLHLESELATFKILEDIKKCL